MSRVATREHSSDLLIIGDGFAATAALVRLRDAGLRKLRILVVGSNERLGPGNAYGCTDAAYRVNVPDRHMTLWPERPEDFPCWARRNVLDPAAATSRGDFYHRRQDYGRYLEERASWAAGYFDSFERSVGRVVNLEPGRNGHVVTSSAGRRFRARTVLLATGNQSPVWPCAVPLDSAEHHGLIQNPWPGSWVKAVESGASVILVGTGLTMIDSAATLKNAGHRGTILAISGSGRLPTAQGDWQDERWPVAAPRDYTALGVMIAARRHIKERSAAGYCWQDGYEDFRSVFQSYWHSLSKHERYKLVLHLRSVWNLVRFRPPPQAEAAMRELMESGRLSVRSGQVVDIRKQNSGYVVETRCRQHTKGDVIVNCTGPGPDPLAERLIGDGWCGRDLFGTWLDTSPSLEVLDPAGLPIPGLFAIGPQTAANQGDVIGTAAISRQALKLASLLTAPRYRR